MRTTTIHIDNIPDVNRLEFFKALGYLSTWCLGSYPYLDIYEDRTCGENSFVGCYRNEPHGESLYCMGMVWNKDSETYSFHS